MVTFQADIKFAECPLKRGRFCLNLMGLPATTRAPDGTELLPERMEIGLTALALSGGSIAVARQALEEANVDPLPSLALLRQWKKRHSARYAELCEEYEPQRRARLAARAEDALRSAIEGTHEGIEMVRNDLEHLEPRDRHTALRNLAVTGGLLNDKMIGPMRGRPTQRIEVVREPGEIMAELRTMFPGVIQGEATDITDVQELPEGLNSPDASG